MHNPELKIQYGNLLDPFFRSLFLFRQEKGLIDPRVQYPNPAQITEKIVLFEAAWRERKNVLSFMQRILELSFVKSDIEVFVVGAMKGAISKPILIGSRQSPVAFADIITHELLHVLISDNVQQIKLPNIFSKFYPEENQICRVHILIYAILIKIYSEFLKQPERLIAFKELDKKYPDYMKAWAIASSYKAENIIKNFKSLY